MTSVSKSAWGTIPLPLVLEDPFSRHKPRHLLLKEDCYFYDKFHVEDDSMKLIGGGGETFLCESLQVQSSGRELCNVKLVVKKEILKASLKECGTTIKVLGLNFCYGVDEETVKIIAENCSNIEYLDLSFSEISDSNTAQSTRCISGHIWSALSASLHTSLTHINLTCFSGIDDNSLSELLQCCQKLEEIELSVAPFRTLKGSSLSKTPKSVRKVSLLIETEKKNNTFAEMVLSSLAKSEAKESIYRLKIRRELTNEAMNVISTHFKQLKCLDIVESSSQSLDYTKLGYSIAALTELEELLLQIPEEQEFNTELSNILHNCPKLVKLAIFGGVIDDETIELFPVLLPNIQFLAFSHLSYKYGRYFEHNFTNAAFETFAKLKKLKHLKINDAFITDRGAIKFFEQFEGNLNELETFDVRNCRKISVKTLNVCLEKSKLRENTDYVPLRVYCDNSYKMETVDANPSTVEFFSQNWVNLTGFWNEYFTPWFNYDNIDRKTENFIESKLPRISKRYSQKTFSRLRSFYLKEYK